MSAPAWRRVVPTLAALALIALTVSLGNWQMRRADEKRALQAQREAAEASAPLPLAGGTIDPAQLDGRRISARGRFDLAHSVFIDNRTHQGIAGFHVLTPLKIAGSDRYVLVLRGWVARDPAERSRLPMLNDPAADVELIGIGQRDLAKTLELGESAPPGPADRLWQNADLASFGRWSGLPLQPLVLRQTEAAQRVAAGEAVAAGAAQQPTAAGAVLDDGLLREWPVPGSDVDKHLGYAFQWYGLATLALGLWLWFVVFGKGKEK
ncbi:MAG: SURF1 family protein [Burkholderiales bacterium]|nr:SURF1 family protein [Burkholderiales bacterium]